MIKGFVERLAGGSLEEEQAIFDIIKQGINIYDIDNLLRLSLLKPNPILKMTSFVDYYELSPLGNKFMEYCSFSGNEK